MFTVQDTSLLDDPKYRQYMNAVDKALRNFESSSEWADLIAALGKLNKVLNPKYKAIPKKITVGKRLAQCMHPALPGGVHLKALQVYDTIFNIIQKKRLQTELYVYSTGLFPLFANASMQVRPVLLNLYETHILPLGGSLNVCVDGILMGLLPGLEEGTEYFERVDSLLQKLSEEVGQMDFFSAMWRCVLIGSVARLAAIQFILRKFNKKRSTEDQIYLIGSDINVMVCALSEAFLDSSVLTQRAAFDVLILLCPLSIIPFPKEDCCVLLVAAIQCLLRRDMSLNRRLYSWMLGHDQSKRHDSNVSLENEMKSFFENHSKSLLIKACRIILLQQKHHILSSWLNSEFVVSDDLYPLKLLVSLLDKVEIGPAVIDQLLLDVFRLLQAAVSTIASIKNEQDRQNRVMEIAKTSSLLLDLFNPGYIWQHMLQMLNQIVQQRSQTVISNESDQDPVNFLEICGFIEMFLQLINVENYAELRTVHLPNMLYAVLDGLTTERSLDHCRSGLAVSSKLLDKCQPSQPDSQTAPQKPPEKSESLTNGLTPSNDCDRCHTVSECLQNFQRFFSKFVQKRLHANKSQLDSCISLLRGSNLAETDTDSTKLGLNLQSEESSSHDVDPEETSQLLAAFQAACHLMLDFSCFPVYCKATSSTLPKNTNFQDDSFPDWLNMLLWVSCQFGRQSSLVSFSFSSSALTTVLDLLSLASSVSRDTEPSGDDKAAGTISVVVLSPLTSHHASTLSRDTSFFQHITKDLWQILGSDLHSADHMSCVQLLIRLHSMCADSRCEDVMLADMLHETEEIRSNALSKFCRLWHLTRILLQKRSSLPVRQGRSFNRCLFALVDCLSSSPSPLLQPNVSGRTVAMTTSERWLRECVERQDLLRVLEPFLLVLLHPNTRSAPIADPTSVENRNKTQMQQPLNGSPQNENNLDLKSSVISDIAEGKVKYRELMSELTTDGAIEQDSIATKANEIVNDAIQDALRHMYMSCDAASDHSSSDSDSSNNRQSMTFKDTNANLKTPTQRIQRESATANRLAVMLLYQVPFDTGRVLYALRSILSLLEAKPRLFTYSASTTSMSSHNAHSVGYSVMEMLARHHQSVTGRGFYGDVAVRSQASMIVEVLINICLRYLRSWHLPGHLCRALHDVRCVACRLLASLVRQLTLLVQEKNSPHAHMTSSTDASSPQQLVAFVWSILSRSGVQEAALVALWHTVQALQAKEDFAEQVVTDFTGDEIPSLSDSNIAIWWSGSDLSSYRSFQSNLLVLVHSLMVFRYRCAEIDLPSLREISPSKKPLQNARLPVVPDENKSFYQPALPIAMQPILLNSVVRVLRLQSTLECHPDWLDFVTSSLPFLSPGLVGILTPVTSQVCRNLENAANRYVTTANDKTSTPADYVTALLRSLRTLTHSTLLLPTSGSSSFLPGGHPTTIDRSQSLASAQVQAAQTNASLGFSTLGSLFNVFSSSNALRPQSSIDAQDLSDEVAEAKRVTLGNLPRIVSCLCLVWNKVVVRANQSTSGDYSSSPPGVHPCSSMGDSDSVAQSVLRLLSPIALQYGENLFSALAVIWERRGRSASGNQQLVQSNAQQLQLVDVACNIKSLRCDAVLALVKQVIMQPPEYPTLPGAKKRQAPYEESLLDLVLCYVQRQPPASVRDSRAAMLALVRDCLAMGTPRLLLAFTDESTNGASTSPSGGKKRLSVRCYFLLLQLVVEYARVVHSCDDKKELKEMQDVTVKCIEACNEIVDWSLEHGGWLARRAPTILPASQHHLSESRQAPEGGSSDALLDQQNPPVKSVSSDPVIHSSRSNSGHQDIPVVSMTILPQKANPNYKHSVEALQVFAQYLANLLDLIFGSEEKEKMIPILTSVITNITPYLRNHSLAFAASYRAAVSLLSSVSGYQQTRRAWKRDALELFLEPGFFRMPHEGVKEWRSIVDHLMTHDATTFKDLLVRIGLTRNTATGASLNIFSNKEQELEQRAMLLKRLAFVIFSSDVNQYQRHLPEIQERLSESLRMHLVPAVQTEVFLCFRVLLVRVSPKHLTSLWPSIITELIQVLGQLEQELSLTEFDQKIFESVVSGSKDRTSAPSSRVGILFSTPTSSSSVSYAQEKWLSLYLAACKLLDLALVLQPSQLQHFKLFRWSFVGEPGETREARGQIHNDVGGGTQAGVGEQGSDRGRRENKVKEGRTRAFVPHCIRIKRLMEVKHPGDVRTLRATPMRHLLHLRKLISLFDLQPFFNTITSPDTMLHMLPDRKNAVTSGRDLHSSPAIEDVISKDFLEDML